MDRDNISGTDLQTMIADYMENGFLDNIIDMFRHDSGLYSLTGALIRDERIRVRIGTTALIEELSRIEGAAVSLALPNLLPLSDHDDPVVRGDAANLLGIIGDKSALPFLEKLLNDKNQNVRTLANEAIEEIRARN